MSAVPGGAVARPAVRRLLPVLLAGVLALAAASCGGDAPGGDGGEGPRPAPGAAAAGEDADSVAADPTGPGPDSARERRPLRAFRFWIRNRGNEAAVVVADAGAGAAVLDTVPPGDSAAARVETRAGRLELRARAGARGQVARVRYDLERPPGDTLLEFEIPPTAPGDTAGG